MPKIFDYKGFHFIIFFQDHPPAHVHVKGHGCEAKIDIDSLVVSKNQGFKPQEIKIIVEFIKSNKSEFLTAWEEYCE